MPPDDAIHGATTVFRHSFSHLDSTEDAICSYLTPKQEEALMHYLNSIGTKRKSHWKLSELTAASDAEICQVEEFRDLLEHEGALANDEALLYCSDLTLLRYLRAREHNMVKAKKMLLETLAWRAETKPAMLVNETTYMDKTSSDARIVGFDKLGRVVVYSSFALTTKRTPEFVKINTMCMMEKADRCTPAHGPGSVVWVNHFGGHHPNGFGWKDSSPKFAWSALNLFGNHYPECLATMIIVDPPSIFFSLWNVVKPLLPEKTAKKGEFIDSRKDNKKLFDGMFGEELADYLLKLIEKDARAH